MRARRATAGDQVRFSGILVGQRRLLRHQLRMLGRCLGQRRVPLEGRQALLRPVRIGQVHHLLLG